MPAPTNLFRVRVAGANPTAMRRGLSDRGIDVGSVRADGTLLVGVTETWNRQSADALTDAFIAAL